MKPATLTLVFLLLVDSVAWAHYVGLGWATGWLAIALVVAFAHRWLEKRDDEIPRYQPRARLRRVA